MAKIKKEISGTHGSLMELVSGLNKTMGEGTIHCASEIPPVRKIRSKIPAFNYCSDGGFPVNRFMEFYGDFSSLKSYLMYDAIARFQRYDWGNNEPEAFESFEYKDHSSGVPILTGYTLRKGYKPKNEPIVKKVALIDIESTYTPDWGDNFGIDNRGLLLIRPSMLSSAVDMIQGLLANENLSLVCLDSLSAVGTDEEIDKSMEDHQMASAAKFWNKAFRKFQSSINANPEPDITMIVINSAYEKVGFVMGDPEKVRNGKQLSLTKSLSIRFRGLKEIPIKTDSGDEVGGRNITIKCMKNKCGVPFRTATFFFSYLDESGTPKGKTNVEEQIIELGIKNGVIERAGAYYTYKGNKAQGMDKFVTMLIEENLIKEVEEDLYGSAE